MLKPESDVEKALFQEGHKRYLTRKETRKV